MIWCLLEQSSPCLPVSHVQFPVVLSQTPALLQSSGHFNPTVKKLGYYFEYEPSSLILTTEFSEIANSIIWLDILGPTSPNKSSSFQEGDKNLDRFLPTIYFYNVNVYKGFH